MSLFPVISKLSIDGRSLHDDDERLAVSTHFDVAEEAGPEQRPDRFLDAALVQAVADVDRQVVVDRALGYALQALDADVADGECARALRGRCAGMGQEHPERRAASTCFPVLA